MEVRRLRVSIRVGGETKGSPTYHKLVEDLIRTGLGGGRIVQGGFAGYRIVPLSLSLPSRPLREAGEAVGSELVRQLREGLGVDPRLLSGRLVALIEAPGDGESVPPAASALRAEGYSTEAETEARHQAGES
jgi:hypothetical protein